jgi:2-iminobutanoate/2-iminopropanoate deaminase
MRFSLFLIAALAGAADFQSIVPPGIAPTGPCPPGVRAGSFVYVSAQGAHNREGALPSGVAAQMQQSVENLRAILTAAGLTLQHVVYARVYLTDMSGYEEMNRVWASYFTGDRPPARVVIGVARLPRGTTVAIDAVAHVNAGLPRLIRPRGYAVQSAVALAVRADDRLYISGLLGRRADTNRLPSDSGDQAKLALDHLRVVLDAAGKRLTELNVTVYVTEALDLTAAEKRLRADLPSGYTVVPVASLPLGANIEIAASSAPDLFAESAHAAPDRLLAGFTHSATAVGFTVYAGSLDALAGTSEIWPAAFAAVRPTCTIVQPLTQNADQKARVVMTSVK